MELVPSLELILNSSLSEDDKLGAMRLFEAALADPWSPMRDPRTRSWRSSPAADRRLRALRSCQPSSFFEITIRWIWLVPS